MLFHKEIFWDKSFDVICYSLFKREIRYSFHLKNRLIEKRIDKELFKSAINSLKNKKRYFGKYGIFEVEANKYIEKFVIRVPYSRKNDLCIVFQEKYNKKKKEPYLLVKTCWLNNINDNHSTLDNNRYSHCLSDEWKPSA